MTPLHDKEIKGLLKNLDGQLRMKPVHHEKLRNRILIESEANQEHHRKRKPSRNRTWLAVAVGLLLLIGTSPFYSPAMASFMERIIPLEITLNSSKTDSLHEEILQIAMDNGYSVSSVSTTPEPFTVHLAFTEGEVSLTEMEQIVAPLIRDFLYEQGIDQYQLDMTVVEESEYQPSKTSLLMDKVEVVLSEIYLSYGYTDLAAHATYGIKDGWFSNTLEVDMPDHVEESEEIKQLLIDIIEKEQWDIQKVELRSYNVAHRGQEDRWAVISSEIHDALAGKAIYRTTGVSYKVKDGMTQVKIKTALPEKPEPQLLSEVEAAIQTYLATNEINSIIQEDQYRIQLLSEKKTILLEVTKASK
ncbi:hypothetical protein [Planococcus halocryophilus]|uniref:hypothetical protein n=1 Tax=Planococcus halocryophilus TaxID=1215089 RepID=UPI001F0DE88C|nr:hypothetical protein [Planococcus halocryophilus]MCH4827959.1 hypothetical protein [Planococcus halocryophilus]